MNEISVIYYIVEMYISSSYCCFVFGLHYKIHTFTCSMQVQDFYLSLKFNDITKTTTAMYRLFLVCCMLQSVKVPGTNSKHHNYPKMQLIYLMTLQYWKETDACIYQMMLHNTGIFNEELGETTFSMLSRCVLGDTVKDDFDHMNRMYSLLPIIRELKDDIMEDSGVSNSLSWRHKIDVAGDEVVSTKLWFKRTIKQIENGTYRVYQYDMSNYKVNNIEFVRSQLPSVYMDIDDLQQYIDDLETSIRRDAYTYYSHRYELDVNNRDILGFRPGDHFESCDLSSISASDGDDEDDNIDTFDETIHFDDSIQSDRTQLMFEPDDVDNSGNRSGHTIMESPYLSRTWNAWGIVHSENQMCGNRTRRVPQRLAPSSRRIHKRRRG